MNELEEENVFYKAHCEYLEAECEKFRKDAERYRFLRSDDSNGKVDLCVTKAYWDENCRYVVLVNEGADWAIDAVMQENK